MMTALQGLVSIQIYMGSLQSGQHPAVRYGGKAQRAHWRS